MISRDQFKYGPQRDRLKALDENAFETEYLTMCQESASNLLGQKVEYVCDVRGTTK